MSKKPIVICAAAAVLAVAPAMAQTTTAPITTDRPAVTGGGSAASGAPATQPGVNVPVGAAAGTMGMDASMPTLGAGRTAAVQGTGGGVSPLATPEPGQMMGSDIRGTRVYGADAENIGTINDILVDRNGRVVALIVGVGGFLGIGQKDVAIPFQAVEIVAERGVAGTAGSAVVGGPPTAGSPGTIGTTGGTGVSVATTGTAVAGSGTVNPDRIVLRGMTRADLQSAPEFHSDGRRTTGSAGNDAMGGAPASSGAAHRQ